jgi:hypothetical protein
VRRFLFWYPIAVAAFFATVVVLQPIFHNEPAARASRSAAIESPQAPVVLGCIAALVVAFGFLSACQLVGAGRVLRAVLPRRASLTSPLRPN